MILGDFNIQCDCQRNANYKYLANILRSANLRQERTHSHGHILDLVISRDDDNLIKGVSVSSMLSDNFLININISLQKQSVPSKVIHIENISRFTRRLILLICEFHLWYWFHWKTWIIWGTKKMSRNPMLLCYIKNMQTAKRHRMYCEWLWIKTCFCVNYEMFKVSNILVEIPSSQSE